MADEKREKQDLRQELADRLIAQIEQGTARWQRPWEAGDVLAPVNVATGKPYRGVNQDWLLMLSPDPSDPRWMTLKQANALGWLFDCDHDKAQRCPPTSHTKRHIVRKTIGRHGPTGPPMQQQSLPGLEVGYG